MTYLSRHNYINVSKVIEGSLPKGKRLPFFRQKYCGETDETSSKLCGSQTKGYLSGQNLNKVRTNDKRQ